MSSSNKANRKRSAEAVAEVARGESTTDPIEQDASPAPPGGPSAAATKAPLVMVDVPKQTEEAPVVDLEALKRRIENGDAVSLQELTPLADGWYKPVHWYRGIRNFYNNDKDKMSSLWTLKTASKKVHNGTTFMDIGFNDPVTNKVTTVAFRCMQGSVVFGAPKPPPTQGDQGNKKAMPQIAVLRSKQKTLKDSFFVDTLYMVANDLECYLKRQIDSEQLMTSNTKLVSGVQRRIAMTAKENAGKKLEEEILRIKTEFGKQGKGEHYNLKLFDATPGQEAVKKVNGKWLKCPRKQDFNDDQFISEYSGGGVATFMDIHFDNISLSNLGNSFAPTIRQLHAIANKPEDVSAFGVEISAEEADELMRQYESDRPAAKKQKVEQSDDGDAPPEDYDGGYDDMPPLGQ